MAHFITLSVLLGTTINNWSAAAADEQSETAACKQNEDCFSQVAFVQTMLDFSLRSGHEASLDAKHLFGDRAEQHGHQTRKGSSAIGAASNATDIKIMQPSPSIQKGLRLENDSTTISQDCFQNTGGSCSVFNCPLSHGQSYCSKGRCICEQGYCSSAGGKCYQGPYKLVLDNFTIRNYRWTGEYMYASIYSHGFGHSVKISRDNRHPRSRFRLFEMPDGAVVLYNIAFPQYLVTISRSESSGDSNNSSFVGDLSWPTALKAPIKPDSYTYDVALRNIAGSDGDQFVNPDPQAYDQALMLYEPPHGDWQFFHTGGAIMIGGYNFKRGYLHVSKYSWDVSVSHDDPGDGALWIFDPPLPRGVRLNRFQGRICLADCSGEGVISSKAVLYIALCIAMCALGASCIVVPMAVTGKSIF